MRMRWPVALAGLAVVLAGCTPAPQPEPATTLLPEDLAWRYAQSCPIDPPEGDQQDFCLDGYSFEPNGTSYNYVNSYERAQLYDWYTRNTVPCLSGLGVTVPAISRSDFFDPADRPWNPYTDMSDVPFDQLIALYQACPPVPDYLQSRHEK